MGIAYRTSLIIISCAVVLHIATAFQSASGFSGFTIGLLLWSIFPYGIALALSYALERKRIVLWGLIPIFLFDLLMFGEVFIFPSSSTASIGLLFMPLWNLVLILPGGMILGLGMEKISEKKFSS